MCWCYHNHDRLYASKSHKHDNRYSLLGHNHDDLYATLEHLHDDRYYTEDEINDILAGLGGNWPFSAKVIVVDPTNPNADYDNPQDAIDNANVGDVIWLAPGTYSGYVELNKAITLRGFSRDSVTLLFDNNTTPTLTISADGAIVETLTVKHTGLGGKAVEIRNNCTLFRVRGYTTANLSFAFETSNGYQPTVKLFSCEGDAQGVSSYGFYTIESVDVKVYGGEYIGGGYGIGANESSVKLFDPVIVGGLYQDTPGVIVGGYIDGTTGAAIHTHDDRYYTEDEVDDLLEGVGGGRVVGEITMWPTDTAPTGWMLCYGQAVSRSTYAALFAVIGTTFGVGDGSTTFNLPDFRGRMALGQDDMGGSSANRVTNTQADAVGGNAGEENHTLITSEMPSHSHTANARQSAVSGSNLVFYTTGTSVTTVSTNTAGSDGAHNNMPPYLTLNFIIYSGV